MFFGPHRPDRSWLILGSAAVLACGFLAGIAGAAQGRGRGVTFASSDGTLLAGRLYEAPATPAPAIVLVHMLGRSKDEWAPLAERLQQAGATVLAIDLRGHGQSLGDPSDLESMTGDVRGAIEWISTRPGVRASVGLVGASLGANLAAIAGGSSPVVRAVALVSPSLDYRGLRLDAGVLRHLDERAVWMAASTDDPYALRTVKELVSGRGSWEQRLSGTRAHGTPLLMADPELAPALVDWLRRTLIF